MNAPLSPRLRPMSTSISCTTESAAAGAKKASEQSFFTPAPVEVLREVVRRYGTPVYAYDISRIRAQAAKLREHLPQEVEVLYSLKANASLGLCGVLAECGLGADVASAGELTTALAAGFPRDRIFLTGPDRSPAVLAQLRSLPDVVISVDSASELRLLAKAEVRQRALLRLRPDFCSYATCAAGPDSRFGLTFDELTPCRSWLASPGQESGAGTQASGARGQEIESTTHHSPLTTHSWP